MRMTVILASMCSLLISCATFNGGGEGASQEQASLDGNALPVLHDIGDGGQATQEAQMAEQQTAQVDTMNEQRSNSELDAAAPESSAVGSDSFYASSQPAVVPQVEQVTESPMPSVLPDKQNVASWDQHTEPASTYQYQEEKPAPVKKSKKVVKHKKESKKVIAKASKKSKKTLAKVSKKSSKKVIAKKSSKVDCKKIAKNTKKSSKREVAMCKAEKKKKVASHKSQKSRKLASAGASAVK